MPKRYINCNWSWKVITNLISSAIKNRKAGLRTSDSLHIRAGVMLLLTVGLALAAWLYSVSGKSRFKTKSGEQTRIELPDLSVVILAPHSSVEFKKTWNPDEIREVWVEGEAHFEVKDVSNEKAERRPVDKFVVHVHDKFKVEVSDAVFNVKYRKERALAEVEQGEAKVTDLKSSLTIRPGETVARIGTQPIARADTDVSLIYNWIDRELIMDEAELEKVLQIIEENFGKPVKLDNDLLRYSKLDGILPLVTEKGTISALASMLNMEFQITGSDFILTSSKVL